MRRSRKIMLVVLLGILVVAGSIGGVVLAQTDGEESPPEPRCGAFLDKVCDNYEGITGASINCTALKEAFAQAGNQLRDEAQAEIRQRLLDEGITEEQLNELEAWLKARPDFPTDQFKAWLETRPDLPFHGPRCHDGIKPFGRFGGPGGGFHRFGGPCFPPNE